MNRVAWLSYSPWGGKELAMTECTHTHTHTHTRSEYPSLVIKVVRYVQNYSSSAVELIAGFLPTDTNPLISLQPTNPSPLQPYFGFFRPSTTWCLTNEPNFSYPQHLKCALLFLHLLLSLLLSMSSDLSSPLTSMVLCFKILKYFILFYLLQELL